jgi:hypothetical protein
MENGCLPAEAAGVDLGAGIGFANVFAFRKVLDRGASTYYCGVTRGRGHSYRCARGNQSGHFLETNMKTILSVALALGVCGFARAADKEPAKADPVGTWKCEYEIGGAKRTSTLSIKKDGDKLEGTMSWPDQKEEKLKDLKLKDATLTFSAVRKIMDLEIPVDYTLTIDGDQIKGKGASDRDGQKYEWDITAQREKKDKQLSAGR